MRLAVLRPISRSLYGQKMTDTSLKNLVAEVLAHCVGSNQPSSDLMDRGRFPKNWVGKYAALLERCETMLAGRDHWPRDLVAALHFASLYLPIRYESWHHCTGSTREETERGLRTVRARTEVLLMRYLPSVDVGELEPVGAHAPWSGSYPSSFRIVDEASVSLCVFGEDLDPAEVTRLLGVAPTRTHRRGDRTEAQSRPSVQGAWIRQVRCEAPVTPEAALRRLLDSIPRDHDAWLQLAAEASVQVRVACHFTRWNKGFSFSPDVVRRLGELGLEVRFAFYGDREDDADTA